MRPKTFPATTYSGNSRQRLQEIREGLKQPSKSSGQVLPVGPGSETSLDPKILVGKDAARQQQMRPTAKFGPYQKALREIRYSLLPFANESGTSATIEVNRQMLQELVNAGCDQAHQRATQHSSRRPRGTAFHLQLPLCKNEVYFLPMGTFLPSCTIYTVPRA
uniref:Large tumor suppressor kinase 2 n=1 Tax=Crocodylus porosus TaxID=8502 RepID=A0A7M4F2U7_CROPO